MQKHAILRYCSSYDNDSKESKTAKLHNVRKRLKQLNQTKLKKKHAKTNGDMICSHPSSCQGSQALRLSLNKKT